jgi:hypothetical protein
MRTTAPNTARSATGCRFSAAAREEIEALLAVHGLVAIGSDPLPDLVAAQRARMIEEGLEPHTRQRYLVWGEVAG